ncbi:hypothetical protein MMC10_008736 [Thelotrema lepadinum]|nr:hypothetical protein [Thelotrema lepadinum]
MAGSPTSLPWTDRSISLDMQSSSVLLPLPQSSGSTASPSDTLQAVSRQISFVQQELQKLLDAQSTGLLSGLGREAPHPTAPSTPRSPEPSIRTPSKSPPGPIRLSSPSPASLTQGRRPKGRQHPIPLSTARFSIHKALLQLSKLKASESSALAVQQDDTSTFLTSLESLAAKKKGIEDSIKSIEGEDSDRSAAREGDDTTSEQSFGASPSGLRDEEAHLSSEIHSIETRLYELKARLAHVRRLRQERDNRLAARLSSWKGALTDVEKSIQREVMEGRGLEDVYPSLRHPSRRRKEGQGVWALPRERRTIDLVKEEVEGNATKLSERKEEVEGEGKACVEGATIWKGVVRKVEAVERRMRTEMGSLDDSSTGESPDMANGIPQGAKDGMTGVLKAMDQTVEDLEEEVTAAETKRWNLLVCAIGAELEALKQGRDMLIDALHDAGILLGGMGGAEPDSSMMTARSRFSDSNPKGSPEKTNVGSLEKSPTPETAPTQSLVDFTNSDQENGVDSGPSVEMHPLGRQETAPHGDEEDDDDEPGPDFLVEHV